MAKNHCKNHWYAILESKDLKQKAIKVKRFSMNLVLWRTSKGEVVCFLDRCSHRGAALSDGQLVGQNCIRCPFHGFEFGTQGDCTLIPSNGKNAKIPASLKLKKYQVREKNGLVWLWFSDSENELCEIPWFEELETASFLPFSSQYEFPISFYRTMEASLDYAHFQFVHSFFKIKGAGPFAKEFKARTMNDRIDISGVFAPDDGISQGVPFKGSVIFPGLSLTPAPTREGKVHHIVTAACPIDEKNTWLAFKFLVPSASTLLEKTKACLQQSIFAKLIIPFLSWQDKKVWSVLPDLPRPGEEKLFANADAGIIEYKKIWNAEARAASSDQKPHLKSESQRELSL